MVRQNSHNLLRPTVWAGWGVDGQHVLAVSRASCQWHWQCTALVQPAQYSESLYVPEEQQYLSR
jgi:hypothetical protein